MLRPKFLRHSYRYQQSHWPFFLHKHSSKGLASNVRTALARMSKGAV